MEKDFMEAMLDKALEVLKDSRKDEQRFCPIIAFLKKGIGTLLLMTYTSEEEKKEMFRNAGKFLGVEGIYECMMIDDTYFVAGSKSDKMNFIIENWDIEKPSMYPPELRREALTLMVINFKDPTQETMWMAEYATSGPNVIVTGIEKNPKIEIAGLIKDSILEGFLIGLATKLGAITPQEFSSHIDAEYPALSTYLKNHFCR